MLQTIVLILIADVLLTATGVDFAVFNFLNMIFIGLPCKLLFGWPMTERGKRKEEDAKLAFLKADLDAKRAVWAKEKKDTEDAERIRVAAERATREKEREEKIAKRGQWSMLGLHDEDY